MKKEHFLWQLLNIERDLKNTNEELENEEKNFEEVSKEQEEYEADIAVKKKEQASYLKEMMRSEKSIAKKKVEFDKKVSSLEFFCMVSGFILWLNIL